MQALLGAAACGLLLINQKGSILYSNRAVEDIFGYKTEALINQHLSILLLPSMRQQHKKYFDSFFEKALSRDMGKGASFPGFHCSGKTVHVSIALSSIDFEGDTCVLATITKAALLNETTVNLAYSKANLASKIEENNRLINVAKNSLDAVYLLDQKQRISWANNAGVILLHKSKKETVGASIETIVDAKTTPDEKNKFLLALHKGLSYTGELYLGYEGMQAVPVSCSLQPVFENEMLQGFSLNVRDITNKRLLELQMRENNELLETIARIASLGFFSLDVDKNELTWSEQVYKIHELPVNSHIDVSDALKYYAPEAQAKISQAVDICMATGKSFDLELPFITAKNRRIWVRSVGYAEFIDGQPKKLKGAFQDITYMRQAAFKAEQAALTKSSFLANMSHELRTPISGILGLSEILSETELNQKQLEYLSMVQNSGNSLLFIVNQVLDYAKLDSGSQKLHHSTFNLTNLINHKTYIHALAADDKGCKFTIDILPDVPENFYGDSDRIAQVLTNLCSNAVKFTSDGEIIVRVSIATNGFLKVEVLDSGVGISKQDMMSLFQEFQQLDSTFSREHQGTGLGLTISKQLISLMDGEIGVTSELGKGSVFWFTIPIETGKSNQAHENKRVSLPNTLVLAASELDCEQWRILAKEEKFKIKAISSMAEVLSELKTDPHWTLTLIADLPSDIPISTCIASLKRFTKQDHKLVINNIFRVPEHSDEYYLDMPTSSVGGNSKEYWREQFFHLQSWYAQFTIGDEKTLINKHILIVEDNKINQALITGLLSSTGLHISIANNGKEALTIIEQDDSIDLVIMDCQMPVMDGFEATKRIRKHKNKRIAELRITAATAHGFEEDIQACFAVGMNDVLVKPFTKQQLLDNILCNL
jgi:PAS domain S-box-containing protein